jgi:hypothetical protein
MRSETDDDGRNPTILPRKRGTRLGRNRHPDSLSLSMMPSNPASGTNAGKRIAETAFVATRGQQNAPNEMQGLTSDILSPLTVHEVMAPGLELVK